VAESSKNQVWRDFWRRSIFDFFNSIDPTETSAAQFAVMHITTAYQQMW